MAMVGATHRLLPIILNVELYSPRLARLVTVLLPAGFTILIGGFITSSLRLELAIGGLLVLSIGLYAYNLLRTWVGSGHPGNAASDHLLIATFFLVLMMIMGVLVGANFLPPLPVLTFGSLHLAAYTHMALIGFILQTVLGALSHGIPEILATSRIPSRKKSGALSRSTRSHHGPVASRSADRIELGDDGLRRTCCDDLELPSQFALHSDRDLGHRRPAPW
jgi:hypothetical protein